jgi:bifunctional non-homologous end joining protein LigD
MRPFTPMSPIYAKKIPEGKEWTHQLKWDGYRIIAWVDNGNVELYTKKMLPKNNKFPDLVEALSQLKGTFLLDGEAVILDPKTKRPSFQMLQQRDKKQDSRTIQRSAGREKVQYIIFDLLQIGEENLRLLNFTERHERLQKAGADWSEPLFLMDLFEDGETLWQWVVNNGWEGVVSKRKSSPYKEGKEHRDWYKRKTILDMEVEIVGILYKEGRLSSLITRKDGVYRGRTSLGLNEKIKSVLRKLPADRTSKEYFPILPDGLRKEKITWLNKPFLAEVTGSEITESGSLRHPKITSLEIIGE